MKTRTTTKLGFTLAGVLALIVLPARADIFGTGANTFTIDFVNIGNAGNPDDAGAGGGLYSSPYGGVSYLYRMGVYEISQAQIDLAIANGLMNVTTGPHTGNEPAANIKAAEVFTFVNWLNTSTGHHAAYKVASISGVPGINETAIYWSSAESWQLGGENRVRHKDAYYFLPSEDEWYKAAYHQNDGVTANYWDYATGSNAIPVGVSEGTLPGSAVYNSLQGGPPPADPADVDLAGGLSPYGTMGQNGNVSEWFEDWTGFGFAEPGYRGGAWFNIESGLRSSSREFAGLESQFQTVGFRVASVVPEPSAAMLMLGTGLIFLARRRHSPPKGQHEER